MSGVDRMPLPARARMAGLSLIELMVATVIGLIVLGAVTGIFLSSQQAYRTTEGLGRVQEGMQFGFELMARDIREAGGNPCDFGLPLANVADPTGARWWTNWAQPLRGFDNGALAGSAAAARSAAIAFGTFLILFNNLIPISLYVTLEFVKFRQGVGGWMHRKKWMNANQISPCSAISVSSIVCFEHSFLSFSFQAKASNGTPP